MSVRWGLILVTTCATTQWALTLVAVALAIPSTAMAALVMVSNKIECYFKRIVPPCGTESCFNNKFHFRYMYNAHQYNLHGNIKSSYGASILMGPFQHPHMNLFVHM